MDLTDDAQRAERRDQIDDLLARLQHHGTLTVAETARLRDHINNEIRLADEETSPVAELLDSMLTCPIDQPGSVEPPEQPRLFHLQRDHDVSGVSGTGRVANGVLWPDGTVSLRWIGERPSTVHWDRLADAEAVHGHGGATRIVWADEPPPADRAERAEADRDWWRDRAYAVQARAERADRAAILREAADAVFALDYDDLVSEQDDENLGSMREAWDLGTIHASQLLRRLADEATASQTEPGTCGHRSSDGHPCNEPHGHFGYHRNARQGGNEWTSWVGDTPVIHEDEGCGAEPPDGWPGDCWCTLAAGHDGTHRCEPCSTRHDAPGWSDENGCPTDQLPLHAQSGVDTPGCDCGHDGMGAKWHDTACGWRGGLLAAARQAAAKAADETQQQPETDEERADREETERDHARGDHTYCGITCEVEMPTEHLRNFVIAKGYPGTKGALDELLRRATDAAQPQPEPPVHGESVAHLAGLHDNEPATDAQTLADLFEGFGRLLATSSRDWGQYRVDAWLYAVILGWDCEETVHDETCTHGAMEEMQRQHGWSDEAVAKARRYRAAVRALTQPAVDARQDGARQ
ncbi:hypothetical protein [Streptomyces sp. G1]|uniref:hypothetical protein n=1 Tax=Streptomyces sp. G1 TaxID=361572 RepID=UPI00202EC6A4|nr:hypothetical protein [Streptomyces sp. G1]MCM1974609.1 hypothetical protein [Streptomyces sp. G1]